MPWIFLLLLLSVAGCENSQPCLADAPDVASVRWEHLSQFEGEEPICFDATVTRGDETHILCEWDCLMFWTNLRGVGRYYVSREWIRVDAEPNPQWVSGQFFPYPENANEQSWPCEGEGSP
jgi:hypothetical protein